MKNFKKLYGPFLYRIQLSQGCISTTRRLFTFDRDVSRSILYSFGQPRKDEALCQLWSYQNFICSQWRLVIPLLDNSHLNKSSNVVCIKKFQSSSPHAVFSQPETTILENKFRLIASQNFESNTTHTESLKNPRSYIVTRNNNNSSI